MNDGKITRNELGEILITELNKIQSDITTLINEVLNSAQSNILTFNDSTPQTIINKVSGEPSFELTARPILINLLGGTGDCEDLTKWTRPNSLTAEDTSVKLFGNKSFSFSASESTVAYAYKDVDDTGLNYYFVSAYAYIKTNDTGAFGLFVYDKGLWINTILKHADKTKIGVWQRIGLVVSKTDGFRVLIGRSNIGLTEGNIDGVAAYKISQTEYDAVQAGSITIDQLLAKYPYVNGIQPMMGLCIETSGKNLFERVLYKEYNPAYGVLSIYNNGYKMSNVDGAAQKLTSFRKLKANTTYTLSADISDIENPTGLFMAIRTYETDTFNNADEIYNKAIKTSALNMATGKQSVQITTGVKDMYVGVVLGGSVSSFFGKFIADNIQVEESASFTVYSEPDINQFIVDSEFYNINGYADRLIYKNGITKKIKIVNKVLLDGSLTSSYISNKTGYKRITWNYIAQNHAGYSPLDTISAKYDKTPLKYSGSADPGGGDYFWLSDDDFYLTVANDDSGWGNNYTPTNDEIKAYLNGWRMYEGGSLVPYDGTGQKMWGKIYCGIGTLVTATRTIQGTETSVLPTTMNDADYTPYEFWYILEQEEQEIIEPIGKLKLRQGYNYINILTGIVQEKVKFVLDTNYYTNIDASLGGSKFDGSEFRYKNKNISVLYKDGEIDNTAGINLNSWAYGKYTITLTPNNYDPSADYRAKYEVLHENYDSRQIDLTLKYESNLIDSYNNIIRTTSNAQENISDIKSLLKLLRNDLNTHDSNNEKHIMPFLVNSGDIINNANDVTKTGMYYLEHLALNRPNGVINGALFVMAHSSIWVTQLLLDWRTNKRYTRICNNGTWGSWEEVPGVMYNDDKYMNAVSDNSSGDDPNATQNSYMLTKHSNGPNPSYFYHILTMFHVSKTGYRAQIAVSYDPGIIEMYIRSYYGTAWTAWTKIANAIQTVRGVTGSMTLILADVDATLNCNNSSDMTVTIPTNASVAFPISTEIAIIRQTASNVSIVPATGVTLNSEGGKRRIKAQYSSVVLKKIGSDTWVLVGALSA